MPTRPCFPDAWMSLLIEYSSLGKQAPVVLAEIEARITAREVAGATVFPLVEDRYRALSMLDPADVTSCLIGQDAYHGVVTLADGRTVPQATGLCFSIPGGAKLPPSLRNIYKELATDLGEAPAMDGDLSHWARQGCCMLNAILTVEAGQPKSHDKLGWQRISSGIIEALSKYQSGLVFILWGNSARALKEFIADNNHTLIESSHPSPIGGSCFKGFFGSRPFSRTNEILRSQGKAPIQWIDPLRSTGTNGQLF